jgi:hypothetical protein
LLEFPEWPELKIPDLWFWNPLDPNTNPCFVNKSAVSCGANTVVNNHNITDISQAPATIIANAGLEADYQDIKTLPDIESLFPPNVVAGDVNNDQQVNIHDLRELLGKFTDIFSFNNILSNYGYPSAPVAVFPSQNLVEYFKMDETDTGLTATGTTLVPGKIGRGRSFNGTGDLVIFDNESSFDFEHTQPFSFSVWLKDSGTTGYRNIFYKQNHPLSVPGYFFRIYDNVAELVLVRGSGNFLWVRETVPISDGNWKHLVVTYDGSGTTAGVKFYVGGAPVATNQVANFGSVSTILNDAKPIMGGAKSGTTDLFFSGTIDELGIWNRALTAQEVKTLYNNGQGLQPN